MLMAWQKSCSLRQQAIFVGIASATTISKQAIHKILGKNVAGFLLACLAAALSRRVGCNRSITSAVFGRILIEDSTCLALDHHLCRRFPGPANQSGKTQAGLRVQCLYDVLAERFVHFALSPFTRNDQAGACDVLDLIKPDDLLVRDLGYFVLSSLKGISDSGAFFLTRLRYGLSLFCPQSKEPINLTKLLRAGARLDMNVLLSGQKLPVRLIAFPVCEALANERRRKARANRDKRLNHSEDYMHRLGWNVFITNAPAKRLPRTMAPRLYRLRWRIEIIFKAWKSHFCMTQIQKIGTRQLEALVYGLLLFIVITHHQPLPGDTPHPSNHSAPLGTDPAVSLLRLSDILAGWFMLTILAHLTPQQLRKRLLEQINSHARYDRRTRVNYIQLRTQCLG